MIKKQAKKLNLEDFKKYGTFANMIDPEAVAFGEKPVQFFRDIIQDDNQGTASYSICRVEPRDFLVDVAEYHNVANEAILPLDGDIYIHVGIATADDIEPDAFEIYFVPKGTLVVIRRGVWHHAPFAAAGQAVNTIIVLPERTYKNDCIVVDYSGERSVEFEGI
jgi:ureidoglycolate lyase